MQESNVWSTGGAVYMGAGMGGEQIVAGGQAHV